MDAKAEKVALFRYGLIAPLVLESLPRGELTICTPECTLHFWCRFSFWLQLATAERTQIHFTKTGHWCLSIIGQSPSHHRLPAVIHAPHVEAAARSMTCPFTLRASQLPSAHVL